MKIAKNDLNFHLNSELKRIDKLERERIKQYAESLQQTHLSKGGFFNKVEPLTVPALDLDVRK